MGAASLFRRAAYHALALVVGERRAQLIVGGPVGDPALARIFGVGAQSQAGEPVTEETLTTLSAFFNGVTIIANAIGTTSLVVYERTRFGKDRARAHPAFRLLHRRPNPTTTAYRFRKTMQQNVLTWGNGFAEIERDGSGRPLNLWPIHPSRIRMRVADDEPFYFVRNETGPETAIVASNMLHVRNYSRDGHIGYSVVALIRESVGLGLAAEYYGARFFGNSAQPNVVLIHPAKLSDDAQRNIKESWAEQYGGRNRGKTGVLQEGMKIERLGMPNDEAQFLETRLFQVTEIARWLNLPPHKLKDLTRGTFSNIEHQSIETVTDCFMPWFKEWEEECSAKLLTERESEDETHFIRFNANSLMRGDAAGRSAFYQSGLQNGWLCPDDVRELEDLNPLPDGQGAVFLRPANMVPAASLLPGAEDDTPATDTPPPKPPDPQQTEPDPAADDEPPADDPAGRAAAAELISDAVARVRRKHAKALATELRRADKAGESADARIADWTRKYEAEVRTAFEATFAAAALLVPGLPTAADAARRYIDLSLAELDSAHGAHARLLGEWESEACAPALDLIPLPEAVA